MTCLADVISYYKGCIIRPRDVNETANMIGAYPVDDSSIIDRTKVMNEYGLKLIEELDYKDNDKDNDDTSKKLFHKNLTERLKDNKPTILFLQSANASDHFVVAVGARYKGNKEGKDPAYYIVNDPGSNKHEARYISVKTMMSLNKNRKVGKMYLYDL